MGGALAGRRVNRPRRRARVLTDPHTGEAPRDQAVDRFHTCDVLKHAWDLARVTGQGGSAAITIPVFEINGVRA